VNPELLIEAAASAHREHDAHERLLASSEWWDLDPEARERLFELQLELRRIEQALHPAGLSGTAVAVLQRI
jgi:hypothetical protein